MKRLTMRAASLLLALCLLTGLSLPVGAALPSASGAEITISSAGELEAFAKNCSLDTWSQGLTVRLTADLDLAGRTFTPIPTFGGTFLGEGHTIKNLQITAAGSNVGLFRYLQEGAVVRGLTVYGSVRPSGSAVNVGGIVGNNAGAVRNCTFNGAVEGKSAVGGVAGQAEPDVALSADSGTLDRLRRELDTLENLIGRALDRAEGNGDSISAALSGMGAALRQTGGALGTIAANTSLDWDQVRAALKGADAGLQDLQNASERLNQAMTALQDTLGSLGSLSGQLGDALRELADAASLAGPVGRGLERALRILKTVAGDLSKDGPTQFTPLGEAARTAGRGLFDSLTDLSGQLEDLHAAVDRAGDQLAADPRAVSRQFNTVFQVLLSVLSDLQGGADSRELVEDTSDENIAGTRYGKVENCRNERAVDGDRNVGGVAGLSDGVVRESFAKCTLSGADDIGGIAGWADRMRDCRAIAAVLEGTERVGAVAGSGTLENIRNNFFIDTGTAGIDGVSYAGRAQPMTFEELRALPDVPAEFAAFTLTLKAGETIMKEIPFTYAQDLGRIGLPPVPELEGFYGEWPEFDTSGLHSDVLVEAVYYPWITLLDSAEQSGDQEGGLALALAEGQFTKEAALHVQPNPLGTSESVYAWDITLTGTDLGPEAEVPLRLLNQTGGKAEVRQYRDGQWVPIRAKTNGSYLLVSMEGTGGTFQIAPARGNGTLLVLLLVLGVLLALPAVRQIKKRRRKAAAKVPVKE